MARRRSSTSRMYNCQHFILTTKWRKPFLAHPLIKAWCRHYIKRICELRNMEILALAVMDEHVHLFVNMPRAGSDIAIFMRDLKWFTSYNLRRTLPPLKEHKALWGVRYFHRSVGGDRGTVKRYIDNQLKDKTG